MRVSSDIGQLDVAPGQSGDITVNVVNTGTVIDGVTARVVGLPERNVTTRPAVLPLFPEASGELTVTLGLPQSFPAGRHPMTVEVHSRQPDIRPSYLNLDLVVPQAPAITVSSRPELIRARRVAQYILTATNRGNVPLDVQLRASDPQKACSLTTEPAAFTLGAGRTAESVLTVTVPRMFMGTESDRNLTVTALARPTAPDLPSLPGAPAAPGGPLPPGPPDAGEEVGEADGASGPEPLTDTVAVTFRQRPYLTRGLLTALILLAVIALWAAAFLFGLAKVFAGDPITKSAPASFFAATAPTGQAGATAGGAGSGQSGGTGSGGTAQGGTGSGGTGSGGTAGAAPAGALPKGGALPAGVGGTIAGTVTAASSGQPVGRILVEALRVRANGTTVPTASAASQADGSYQVAGLFPARYVLRFSAPGYRTDYYPATPSVAAAGQVQVDAAAVAAGTNAIITGLPATITGTVDPGDVTGKVTTTVQARLLQQRTTLPPIPAVKTKPDGSYAIPNLPAPGNYELTFTTSGYQTSTVQTTVAGGAQRYQSTVVLSAGNAQISGTVTDGTNPLGGATVSTVVNGQTVTTGTPTTGQVGHFVIGNLPTPATYVITVSKDGFSQVSQVIDLAPGKPQNNLTVALTSGTGVVTGRLVDGTGAGIGGATVTVGGMSSPPSTVTLTNGAVGSFQLTGLPAPGAYTLTFSLAGYADQTVPITLTGTQAPAPVTVVMTKSVGTVAGTVTGPTGAGLVNATVSATDGQRTWPVITTGNTGGTAVGGYTIANLPAGLYTITASNAGQSQSSLVTVTAGQTVTANFHLTGGG